MASCKVPCPSYNSMKHILTLRAEERLRCNLEAMVLLSDHSYFCLPFPCSGRDRFKQSLWSACQTAFHVSPLGKQVIKYLKDFHRYFHPLGPFLSSLSRFSYFRKWLHETKLMVLLVVMGAEKELPRWCWSVKSRHI